MRPLGWAIGQASAERALAPVAALGWYWMIRDRYADAVAWVNQALSLPGADAHPALCVHALRAKNLGLWLLGRASAQPATLAKAEAIARALGDPEVLSRALQDRVDHEAARRPDLAAGLADEALACARGSHFKRPRCGRSKRPRRPRKGDACERRARLPAVRPFRASDARLARRSQRKEQRRVTTIPADARVSRWMDNSQAGFVQRELPARWLIPYSGGVGCREGK
jgi:hypothetical protein